MLKDKLLNTLQNLYNLIRLLLYNFFKSYHGNRGRKGPFFVPVNRHTRRRVHNATLKTAKIKG